MIVLKEDGTVSVLVDGDIEKEKSIPFPYAAIQITSGCEHAACLLENGHVYVWGSFEDPGYMFREAYVPARVLKEHTIVQIASGRDHLVALTSEGHVFSMGCGKQGQLGRVQERAAKDGGRLGPKLLLVPGKVHMHWQHKADAIWATERGTFYRDIKSGKIYGCGQNDIQNISAVKESARKQAFIYKPTLTSFVGLKDIQEMLLLKENGDLQSCSSSKDDQMAGKEWTSLDRKAESIVYGPSGVHFIDREGDAYSFKAKKRILPIYIAAENHDARAIAVAETEKRMFIVID